MSTRLKFILLGATAVSVFATPAYAQNGSAAQPDPSAQEEPAVGPPADAEPREPIAEEAQEEERREGSDDVIVDGGARTVATGGEATRASTEAPNELITVTASRLEGGDNTSRKIVIDAEDIRRRGVTSVEELIRQLPENVATIGALTGERANNPLTNNVGRARGAAVSQLGQLGVSAANLFGAGAGNTLVLINGRRVAGAAGIEDGFVNLNGIPLSAIERVEIIPSGGAAVYGSDALGGVINFILRSNFSGITFSSQAEFSNNGADNARFSLFGGYGWGSGNVTATVDYSKRYPIINAKTGYTTEDYSDLFDGNTDFDFRSVTRGGQPGLIDIGFPIFEPEYQFIVRGLTLPPGFTGQPEISDFIEVGRESLRDFVPVTAGPQSESWSGTIDLTQSITDKLEFFANGIYNRSTTDQESRLGEGLSFELAPGQAYNPFPAFTFNDFSPGTTVYYFPADEAAQGIIQPSTLRNTNEFWSVNAGLSYDFSPAARLSVIYTTSQNSTSATGTEVGSIVSLEENEDGTIECTNFFLNRTEGEERARLQAIVDRQCQALTSADPNLAFNPFKSSAGGPGASITDFLYDVATEDRSSRFQQYEARLNGQVISLPAGRIRYAAGADYSDDGVDSREIDIFTGGQESRTRYAFFGELGIPIFGEDFQFPGLRSLDLNIAARNDTYNVDGPVGTVDGIPFDQGGEIIFDSSTFSYTTPSVGIRYQPTNDLLFLAKWGKGFKAPPFTNLFNLSGTQTFEFFVIDDPLVDDDFYSVPQVNAPNPDLKPETSTQQSYTLSWSPSWLVRGLELTATYQKTTIENEFARSDDLARLLPLDEFYALEQLFPRGPDGRIERFNNIAINLIGSEYESITYEASYTMATSAGSLDGRLVLLDNLKALSRGTQESLPISRLGTVSGPDDWSLNGSLTFYHDDDWSVSVFGYHRPSYTNTYFASIAAGRVTNPELEQKVDSYTTFDLTGTWNTEYNIRFNFAVRNMFDAQPPFALVQERPYDAGRYDIAGRTVLLQTEISF